MKNLFAFYSNPQNTEYYHLEEVGDKYMLYTTNLTKNNYLQFMLSSRGRRGVKLQQDYLLYIFDYIAEKFVYFIELDYNK